MFSRTFETRGNISDQSKGNLFMIYVQISDSETRSVQIYDLSYIYN